jgi:tetratricopeptide (TPR) repeat protein
MGITSSHVAILASRKRLASCPRGHPDRGARCAQLALALKAHYHADARSDVRILDETIELGREALDESKPEDPLRASVCTHLADCLTSRYEQSGILSDLEEAVRFSRTAFKMSASGCSEHITACIHLATLLERLYQPKNDVDLLDESAELAQKALELCSSNHPDRAACCRRLAASLRIRYEQAGDVALLDEAVGHNREALALCPAGHPDRATSRTDLAASLRAQHYHTSDVNFINEAISLDQEAVTRRFAGHSRPSESWTSLALSLENKYEQTGDAALLAETLRIQHAAAGQIPAGHSSRGTICRDLAVSLRKGGEQTGDVFYFDQALYLAREYLRVIPAGHANHAAACASVAVCLSAVYPYSQNGALLDEAIQLERTALALRPVDHPSRAPSCTNLAVCLRLRHGKAISVPILEDIVQLYRDALALHPTRHLLHAVSSINLANALKDLYLHTIDIIFIDEAICLATAAESHLSQCRVWRALTLLSELHLHPNTPSFSPTKALEYLLRCCDAEPDSVPLWVKAMDSCASLLWASRSSYSSLSASLVDVYSAIVDKLPALAGITLAPSSRMIALKSSSQVGDNACVAAIVAGQPSRAIEFIDQAQGQIWAQVGAWTHAVYERDPLFPRVPNALARRLRTVVGNGVMFQTAWNMQSMASARDSWVPRAALQNHEIRMHDIFREIRATPGLERFMLGKSFATLHGTARRYPVVVLVAAHGSAYALILQSSSQHSPHVIYLDVTGADLSSLKEAAEKAGMRGRSVIQDSVDGGGNERLGIKPPKKPRDASFTVLAKLWYKVVKPVLDHLQFQVCSSEYDVPDPQLMSSAQPAIGRARPRLCWCPTGGFAFLPLHAASIYDGPSAAQKSCFDHVVSSYTPTLSALLHAQAEPTSITRESISMLLIAEDSAGNSEMPTLVNVDREVLCVEEIAQGARCASVSKAVGAAATTQTVSKRLAAANFVHFACHGIQDRSDALKSGFSLHDGMLTVTELFRLHTSKAQFAYLSACETSKGDARQPDQAVHLAASMLFAGFKSVVATMW